MGILGRRPAPVAYSSAAWVAADPWSDLERDQVLDRLTAPDDGVAAVFHHHLWRHRPAVVVRCHHRAVRARIEDREQVADLRTREAAIAAQRVARLAQR